MAARFNWKLIHSFVHYHKCKKKLLANNSIEYLDNKSRMSLQNVYIFGFADFVATLRSDNTAYANKHKS